MKKLTLIAVLSFSALLLAAARLDMMPTEFKTYKVGETVTFTATAWESKDKKLAAGTCQVVLKANQGKVLKKIVLDFAQNNPATFTAKLDRPGFIFAEAGMYKKPDGKQEKWKNNKLLPANGGAAVEPEKLKTMTVTPKDFDEFWAKGLEEFKNAEIVVTPADDIKRPGYKVSRILVKFPDKTGAIDGFISVPAKPGKYPALIGVPGAGAGRTDPAPYLANQVTSIQLWMNVHTFRTEKNMNLQRKRYAEYRKTFKTKDYFKENADNRDKYLYRNVWLAVSRAADYVAKMPEYNGKMVACGNSQGGGTAIVLAYLNKNVKGAAASVPALADHDGWKDQRQAGWPQLHRVLRGKADKVYGYFDTAVFAAKIKVPVLVSVGFVDTTCSPSSVYSLYNAVPGNNKEIFHMYRSSHSISEESKKKIEDFVRNQFK